jgi:hypothetical protein
MSTKATRRALDYLETITASGYFHPDALAQFKAEVEAIERAAKDLMQGRQFRGSAETIGTLASIVKDAP